MKNYIKRLVLFFFLFILVFEIFSRFVLDPVYFASIDTYNVKLEGLKKFSKDHITKEVDYIFIGSSRVPASINADVFMHNAPGTTAIVAGRGYMTPGIHHQALKNRVELYPDYLKNTMVFLEYPKYPIYTNAFEEERLKVYESEHTQEDPMTHLMLPHLDIQSFFQFLKYSNNSLGVKIDMIPLFVFSAYRTSFFVNEHWTRLNKPLKPQNDLILADEGGIREDRLEKANELAREMAEVSRNELEKAPLLTFEELEKSSISKIANLIHENGGQLFLFEMPMHSLQKEVYSSPKAQKNKKVFENWLSSKGIKILYYNDFTYNDNDFPDTWHLSKERRDEFTKEVFEVFQESQLDPFAWIP